MWGKLKTLKTVSGLISEEVMITKQSFWYLRLTTLSLLLRVPILKLSF